MRKTAAVLALFGAAWTLCACAGEDAAKGVMVTAKEMQFTPKTITVPAGRQTFTVHNAGKLRHTFSLNALGSEVTVVPGGTETFSVDLAPGSYRYVCRVLDHEGLGMHGVLKVRSK